MEPLILELEYDLVMQFLRYLEIIANIAVAFFVWKIVSILYNLFNGWFFGGI